MIKIEQIYPLSVVWDTRCNKVAQGLLLVVKGGEKYQKDEITYVHEKWPDQESETLAVTDMGIVEGVCLKDVEEHLLSFAAFFLEHVDLGECPGEITLNDALVRRVLLEELGIHGLEIGRGRL